MASHRNGIAAYEDGFYDDLAVPFRGLKRDNNLRADTSLEKLKPAFDRTSGHGTLTAGNSTPLTDGTAAVLLSSAEWAGLRGIRPQAWLVDSETAAVQYDGPNAEGLLMAPVHAVPRLLARNGLSLQDFDMQVARQLVLYVQRPGGQTQFSELLKAQTKDHGVFAPLHEWIEKHLGDVHLTVEMLAEQAHMSPRNFARSYKAKTGQTPARALELFRLEAARRLLEQTQTSAAEIARKCGFGTEERMRVTFKRHLKVSPSDYRNHFAAH